jgi:hypothetical protein
MYTPTDILIWSVYIKRGVSPDRNLNFYDQMVRVEKRWVEYVFELFIICHIATWNKVAKCVNMLQDIQIIETFLDRAVSMLKLSCLYLLQIYPKLKRKMFCKNTYMGLFKKLFTAIINYIV